MKKVAFLFVLMLFELGLVFGQQIRGVVKNPDFQISVKDLALSAKKSPTGEITGIDLYIRKKPRVQSVMLVETTVDPKGKEPNYAYRAGEWNEVNGNEIRYLDGKQLNSQHSKYSLVSSTIVHHGTLGECFHIFIPMTLHYGYPWSRNGTVKIGKGTFINIRTYEKKYADYNGKYMDNPFMFDFAKVIKKIEKKPEPPKPNPLVVKEPAPKEEIVLTDEYNSIAAEKFAEIARDSKGFMYYSKGRDSLVTDMLDSMDRIKNKKKVDVVFAIDTTGSMKDDLEVIREEWVPKLLDQLKAFGSIRLGLLFYRDYNDSYLFKGLPVKYFAFSNNPDTFIKCLNTAIIKGTEGGDVPEAVYEALYASLQYYDWRSDAERKIILIGDAEPHDKPRGYKKITREKVMELSEEKGVAMDCIILPDSTDAK